MADLTRFDPEAMLRVLEEHGVSYVLIGGLAAALHGSSHVTTDVDITPDVAVPNLIKLASALADLDARVRTAPEPEGLRADLSAAMLERCSILNLSTRHGDLDLSMRPSGTHGYADLARSAVAIELRGVTVRVAALADVIRSKEAADREKDRLVLPSLRRLQAEIDRRRRARP